MKTVRSIKRGAGAVLSLAVTGLFNIVPAVAAPVPLPTPPVTPVACPHTPAVDPTSGTPFQQVTVPPQYQMDGSHIVLSDDNALHNDIVQNFSLPYVAANKDNYTIDADGNKVYGGGASGGLVPGDCGQITLYVTNNGSREGLLRTYIKSVTIESATPGYVAPVDPQCAPQKCADVLAAIDKFYNTFAFSVLGRDKTTLHPATVMSLTPGGHNMSTDNDSATLITNATDRNNNQVAPFLARQIDQQCVGVGDEVQVPVIYDFPFDPDDPTSGGNTSLANNPSLQFQLYLDLEDALEGDCDPPNLQIAVSDNTYNADSNLVTWTVTALNAADPKSPSCLSEDVACGGATKTYVYLIIDGKNPDLFNITTPDGGAAPIVIWDQTLNSGAGGYRPPNLAAGEKKYITDPASVAAGHDDKHMIILSLDTMNAGQQNQFQITIPTDGGANADWDGDICVTAFISSADSPYQYPAASNQVAVDANGQNPTRTDLAGNPAINWIPSFDESGNPVYTFPWLPAYDWAKHHHVYVAPWDAITFDAGQLNNGDLSGTGCTGPLKTNCADVDQWDYNGWRPEVVTIQDHPGVSLQVAVSQYRYNRGEITWIVTAKNAGPQSADPVVVELAVDALNPAFEEGSRDWNISASINPPSAVPATGIYKENKHVTWTIGLMQPDDVQTLTITIPAVDVTWDGDICVTAVIWSPRNPLVDSYVADDDKTYPGKWNPQVQALYLAVDPDTGERINDIDDDVFKGISLLPFGNFGLLQRNNGSTDGTQALTKPADTCSSKDYNCTDTDQWDYNGWYSDNPTDLKVSVSRSYMVGSMVTFDVTAKNAGSMGSGPVVVEMVIDSLTTVDWQMGNWQVGKPPNQQPISQLWAAGQAPIGRVGQPLVEPGLYKENNHVYWQVGHLEPGEWTVLTLTLPAADVTYDGDICVTAVIYSTGTEKYEGNQVLTRWHALATYPDGWPDWFVSPPTPDEPPNYAKALLVINSVDPKSNIVLGPISGGPGLKAAAGLPNDWDDDLLKGTPATGPGLVQSNNSDPGKYNHVDDDIDQWDYYGWRAAKVAGSSVAIPKPLLTKTGISALALVMAAALAAGGQKLTAARRRQAQI